MLLEYYDDLIEMERSSVRDAMAMHVDKIGRSHQKIADIAEIFKISSGRTESFAYSSILQDLGFSLYHAVTGLYRQSYVSQRVALENTIAALFYSSRLIDLRDWSSGKISVSWSKVAFSEDGVFTDRFIQAFCPEISDKLSEYSDLAVLLYSKLSDFTHKRITTHHYDEYKFRFTPDVFNEVIETFDQLLEVVTFAFLSRYIQTEVPGATEDISEKIANLCGGVDPFSFYTSTRV